MDQDGCQPRWRYKLKPLSAPMIEASTGEACKELKIVAGQLYTFGRSRSCCHIVFEDRRVSRKHCQLYLDPSTTKLFLLNGVDLPDLAFVSPSRNGISVANSFDPPSDLPTKPALNGVFVNGETVAPGAHEILCHGAVVSLVACTKSDQVQDVNFGPAIGFSITSRNGEQTLIDSLASSELQVVSCSGLQTALQLQHKQVGCCTTLVGQAVTELKHSVVGPEEVDSSAEGRSCGRKRRKTLQSSSSACMYTEHLQSQKSTQSVRLEFKRSLPEFQFNPEILKLLRRSPIAQSLCAQRTVLLAVTDHPRTTYSRLHCVGDNGDGEIIDVELEQPCSSIRIRPPIKENLARSKAADGPQFFIVEDASATCESVVVQEDGAKARLPLCISRVLCGYDGDKPQIGLEQFRQVECTTTIQQVSSGTVFRSTCSTHEAALADQQAECSHLDERSSFEGQGKTDTGLNPIPQRVSASNSLSGSGPQFSQARPRGYSPAPPTVFLNKLEGVNETMECNTISLREILEPLDDILAIFAATFTGDIEWFLSSNNIPTELPITIACHDAERCWSLSKNDRLASDFPNWPNLTVVYPPFPNKCAIGSDETGVRRGIGCHHPKLFLLYRRSSIRVVITSANLTVSQWSKVTNNIWCQDFPRLHKRSYAPFFHNQTVIPNRRNTHGDFAAQLAAFISSLVVDVPAQTHWVADLADFDFSEAEATLVASIPGLHGCLYEPVTLCKMEFPDLKQTVTVEQALGVVDTVIVGIAYRFGPTRDPKGVRLRKLASVINRQKEVEQGLIRVSLKRMPYITADPNAVGVFILDECDPSRSVMLLQKDETQKAIPRAYMQLGFLPRDTAKWVAHLCDEGTCIFVGYVSPKDVTTVARGLISGCAQLTLHVYKSAQFSKHLDECHTSEHEAAICCLVRTLKRPLGLWRLQQVLSAYEWPCSAQTDFVYSSSSIGTSIDVKFFAAFAAAAGRRSISFTDLDSAESDPEWGSWTVEHEAKDPSIGIVFPTIERAKHARRGIQAHSGLHHFHENTWMRLKPSGLLLDAVPFPSNREGFPMHVKVARRRFQHESGVSYGWVYYGSHNFSPAAWGRPRFKRVGNYRTSGFANIQVLGCTLFISNYELGVIFVVPPPEAESEMPTSGRRDRLLAKEPSIICLDQLQLPFVCPAKEYESTDNPATGKEIRAALRQSKVLAEQATSEPGDIEPVGVQDGLPERTAEVDSDGDEDDIERAQLSPTVEVGDIDTMWRQAVIGEVTFH